MQSECIQICPTILHTAADSSSALPSRRGFQSGHWRMHGLSTFISFRDCALDNVRDETQPHLLVSWYRNPLSCAGAGPFGTGEYFTEYGILRTEYAVWTNVLGTFVHYACVTGLCSTAAKVRDTSIRRLGTRLFANLLGHHSVPLCRNAGKRAWVASPSAPGCSPFFSFRRPTRLGRPPALVCAAAVDESSLWLATTDT